MLSIHSTDRNAGTTPANGVYQLQVPVQDNYELVGYFIDAAPVPWIWSPYAIIAFDVTNPAGGPPPTGPATFSVDIASMALVTTKATIEAYIIAQINLVDAAYAAVVNGGSPPTEIWINIDPAYNFIVNPVLNTSNETFPLLGTTTVTVLRWSLLQATTVPILFYIKIDESSSEAATSGYVKPDVFLYPSKLHYSPQQLMTIKVNTDVISTHVFRDTSRYECPITNEFHLLWQKVLP